MLANLLKQEKTSSLSPYVSRALPTSRCFSLYSQCDVDYASSNVGYDIFDEMVL